MASFASGADVQNDEIKRRAATRVHNEDGNAKPIIELDDKKKAQVAQVRMISCQ